jgi:hypothetical protein
MPFDMLNILYNYTERFIMYSENAKIFYRKTEGHVFTKPVQIEGKTENFFPSTLFVIVVHISAARRCDVRSEKMVAPRETSFCVLEYHMSKSVVTVQRAFRAKYAKDSPTDKTIRVWYKQYTETGCLCKQKSSIHPLTAEDDVERVQASFLHSPKKLTGTATKKLSMSKTTVWRVLRKRLMFKPYRIQMVQQLSDEDHRTLLDFCLRLEDLVSSGDHFLEKVQFTDETTFRVSGAVNRRNSRIWRSENPHAYVEHQRDSPKVNVFCAISSQKLYGPFFFVEETVTGMTYLDRLQLWLMTQLQNIPTFIFHQDGSPAHFHCAFRQYLNTVLPGRWIRPASGND